TSIMTVAELIHRGYQAKLYISGKGPNEKALIELAKKLGVYDNVFFLGFQDNLKEFYKNIHFYMSTSLTENYSLSCIDALLHNVPCIFSLVDGQPEVNINGKTGLGIYPTLSLEAYEQLSGYSVNVSCETPVYIYDPVNKCLSLPKMASYLHCADAIEKVIVDGNYDEYLDNIQRYRLMAKEKPDMSQKINLFIERVVNS
ncbi:glycosyltransferase, partial [Enterobacteriaceae bacterium LUAb1]